MQSLPLLYLSGSTTPAPAQNPVLVLHPKLYLLREETSPNGRLAAKAEAGME